ARPSVGNLEGCLSNHERGRSLADTVDRARDAAIRSLARDLRMERDDAERWCAAWEQFAKRYGGARSPYFWDAGRGWIDAQRATGRLACPVERLPVQLVNKTRSVGQ